MKFLSLILIFISSLVFAASPNLSRKGTSGVPDYVYVDAAGNLGEAITANTEDIPFSEITDTASAWNVSVFTAPLQGWYSVCGMIDTASSPALGVIRTYINGTLSRSIGGAGGTSDMHFCGLEFLNVGDALSLRLSSGMTIVNTTLQHHLRIIKIPGQNP